MKKMIDKIFSRSDFRLLGLLMVLILLFRIIYFSFIFPVAILYNSDSVTYFTEGFFDLYRTPIYPLLLKFFHSLSEDSFLKYIIYFQQIVSFLSIIPLYYCSQKIINNKILVASICLAYGTFPFVIQQNININPESLCISGSVFMLYFFMRSIYNTSPTSLFLAGLFPLILILLKPTYLILIVIVMLFQFLHFLMEKENRKIHLYGFLGSLLCSSVVFGYCKMNEKLNGEFTLTKIYLDNSLGNIILSDAYKNGNDEELIALIDSTKDKTEFAYYNAIYRVNNESMDEYKKSYESFPNYLEPTADMEFSASIPDNENFEKTRISAFIRHSKSSPIYKTYIWNRALRMLKDYYPISIIIFLQIILISFIYIKAKLIPWIPLFSLAFILSQAFTVLIGGIEDWNRLLLPSFPFVLIIIFSFLQNLISWKNHDKSGQASNLSR